MKIDFSQIPNLKTDLDRTLSKNSLRNGLVEPIHKFDKSVIKTNSQVQESKIYNEVINDSIYGNK